MDVGTVVERKIQNNLKRFEANKSENCIEVVFYDENSYNRKKC